MNHLSSKELLARLKSFVAEERKITMLLIEHLREVERRLLFSELGYGSLFEFCIKELGLSEGSAQRRIQAMRLVKAVPEAKSALESGRLSLSNAARVQSFFQMEKKQGRSTEMPEKLAVIREVETLSQRACEQKLFEISPQPLPQEKMRVIAEDRRELKLVISEEFYNKLELLKGLLAHVLPDANYVEMLEHLTDQALKQIEKRKGVALVSKGVTPVSEILAIDRPVEPQDSAKSDQIPSVHTAAAVSGGVASSGAQPPSGALTPSASPKFGPAGTRSHHARAVEREVWRRAQGRCQYVHEGRRCASRYRLEIDHRIPLALGGSNEPENLRLLCRAHNVQQAALARAL
jgi:hypothetical protein